MNSAAFSNTFYNCAAILPTSSSLLSLDSRSLTFLPITHSLFYSTHPLSLTLDLLSVSQTALSRTLICRENFFSHSSFHFSVLFLSLFASDLSVSLCDLFQLHSAIPPTIEDSVSHTCRIQFHPLSQISSISISVSPPSDRCCRLHLHI